MKAGKNISKIVLIICYLSLFLSCNKENNQENRKLKSIAQEYISKIKQDINLKEQKHDYNLRVKIDSSSINYKVYRISLWTDLLEADDLPNEVSSFEGIKIAFFVKELKNQEEIQEMIKLLTIKEFYNKDSTYSNSYFPEWIILNNKKTGKQLIVKDMWYQPLDSILKKYREKID